MEGSLSSSRGEGMPVSMESGKRLGEPLKEIEIVLRHTQPCLCMPGEHHKNRIFIRLEPKEEIALQFHSKKPGHSFELEERTMKFDFREKAQQGQYTEEYEKLLLDCIAGDQTLFVSSEEIAEMWRFTDPFVAAWRKGLAPLKYYKPDGRAIVAEADALLNMRDVGARSGTPALRKEIGVFGLGKMGANVARQLHDKGWRVIASNRSQGPVEEIAKEGIQTTHTPAELVGFLKTQRIVWMMITAGKGIDEFLFGKEGIVKHLTKGDIVIDAGNSFYEDTVRRARLLRKRGIHFMDVGFSGGPAGARHGGSLMIGGVQNR